MPFLRQPQQAYLEDDVRGFHNDERKVMERPIINKIVEIASASWRFNFPDGEFWLDLLEMALGFFSLVLLLYCVMAVCFGPLFFLGIYGWTQEERDRCRAYDRRHR